MHSAHDSKLGPYINIVQYVLIFVNKVCEYDSAVLSFSLTVTLFKLLRNMMEFMIFYVVTAVSDRSDISAYQTFEVA